MKKTILLVAFAMTVLCTTAQDRYAGLTQNLPFNMPKVTAPVFPSREVNLTKYGAVGDGKTLCTDAFAKAIEEMKEEGGIPARNKRYSDNEKLLVSEMAKLGYRTYIDEEHQGPIITTFFYPEDCGYTFKEMYEFIKERGYAIYPGKVTEADTFRIGTIGEIYREDIEKLIAIYKEFLKDKA